MLKRLVGALAIGILALPGVASASLVANGGFETGDFTSWTATQATIDPNVQDAKSGTYSAVWQDAGQGSLSQTLSTVAGQSYTVDFWANPGAGFLGDGSFFKVEFGNTVLTEITDLSNSANWGYGNYQHFVFNVTGTGSDLLKFSFYSVESEGWLDDVSVTPVPLPAAAWLLGAGLFGLLPWVRRRAA